MLGAALRVAACAVGLIAAMAGPAIAQSDRSAAFAPPDSRFVRLANGALGVLYEPVKIDRHAEVAVLVMGISVDYTSGTVCREFFKRGYPVLCADTSASKAGVSDDGTLDQSILEVRAAVNWLHGLPGVKKVVLFGHSGGATLMTAYQMIAENGVKSCQGAEKIWKCPDSLAGLPRADGVIVADAGWGQSTMSLFSIDPAIADETSGMRLDPALDMFNAANGFVATGSRYSPAFTKAFLTAEGRRNMAVLSTAQTRQAAIRAGKGNFSDDEPYDIPGAAFGSLNNKLYTQDTRLLSRSIRPWPLVRSDGSVVTQIIHSVRAVEAKGNLSPSYHKAALRTTVNGYLSSFATRTTPEFSYGETSEITGVDWRSNYANPVGNAEGVTVPILALGMTGGFHGLSAETIYDHAAGRDKSIAFIEGAEHGIVTCKSCEKTPGQYGDTFKLTYDVIDRWLSQPGRFLP